MHIESTVNVVKKSEVTLPAVYRNNVSGNIYVVQRHDSLKQLYSATTIFVSSTSNHKLFEQIEIMKEHLLASYTPFAGEINIKITQ